MTPIRLPDRAELSAMVGVLHDQAILRHDDAEAEIMTRWQIDLRTTLRAPQDHQRSKRAAARVQHHGRVTVRVP